MIPCLNEALTLAGTISDCHQGASACGVAYEIVVADNGSTDDSVDIALRHGARVVNVLQRGYGAALQAGIKATRGRFVLMGDADGTYCFDQASLFLEPLRHNVDLVMGNRFKGTIAYGAMPFLHRYLGNPVLSLVGRLLFGVSIGDFHCGLRAFRRRTYDELNLCCSGMEFASEMVIKASLRDMRIVEVPTDLRPNPPGRQPHLRTWRDGWRHLKFMLSFSPRYAFLSLGLLFLIASLALYFAYALEWSVFTGATSLLVAGFLSFSACALFSDYVTTRFFFARRYGSRVGRGGRMIDRLLTLRSGVDRLLRLSAACLVLGAVISILVWYAYELRIYSTRAIAQWAFLASLLFSIGLFAYLTGAKISTLLAFQDRQD
ncbi:glycosyltransferase family 2 protein [Synechococcus sp. L2F]|uniref:glycosyltransferase family 2 protein n=1 Tax=Synechococcus sp. L2F TaxID=2823739 RepID=UPI0020CC8ED5|nr:glycosyltransferase family 2 protein [Synechococcus sp. L2F]